MCKGSSQEVPSPRAVPCSVAPALRRIPESPRISRFAPDFCLQFLPAALYFLPVGAEKHTSTRRFPGSSDELACVRPLGRPACAAPRNSARIHDFSTEPQRSALGYMNSLSPSQARVASLAAFACFLRAPAPGIGRLPRSAWTGFTELNRCLGVPTLRGDTRARRGRWRRPW
jgi:hypothetical protein